MKPNVVLFLIAVCAFNLWRAATVQAAEQIWDDSNPVNLWNLANTNWDGGATWTNGNSATFSGSGEIVELGADIVVSGLTFTTNGYVIADANADGTLTIAGSPTVITVASNYTAKISDSVDGSGGLTKTGTGTLEFTTANSYTGVTRIAEGTLKMAKGIPASLGQTGTGNEVVIEEGAALDLNAAYTSSRADHITVSGSGVNGSGAIFSSSVNPTFNQSFGNLTLAGDTTLGVPNRWDLSGSGTVYGNGHTLTKIGANQIAVSRAVNNCPIVVNAGNYTVQNGNALGGTDYATWVNNATLYIWGNYTLGERIYFTGNSILGQGADNTTATFSGNLTVSNTLSIASRLDSNGVAFTGVINGPGGINKNGAGWCYILNSSNSYAGTTTVANGRKLWIGKPDGSIDSGRPGLGEVIVQGDLYFDRTSALAIANKFSGGGRVFIRNDGTLILAGSTSTNSPTWYLGDGGLVLTNGCTLTLPGRDFTMADRLVGGAFDVDPTNITATLTLHDGCALTAKSFICGNGSGTGSGMTSIIHHVGGTVTSTGATAEDNGFRMGHYPGARTTWNMSGGTMICRNNFDLCMATDGQGWLNVTGGEIYTTRVMLNERFNDNGYGRLTLAGGTLHLGSATAAAPTLNAITTDSTADYSYTLELGGMGARIQAVTNIYITVKATLSGAGANAVTFDSGGHTVLISRQISGSGGFNKEGSGVLELSATRSACSGDAFVKAGTLRLSADDALTNAIVRLSAGAVLDLGGHSQLIGGLGGNGIVSNGTVSVTRNIEPGTEGAGTLTVRAAALTPGGTLLPRISADSATSGTLHVTGDLSLSGMALAVANPELLTDRSATYLIATCGGTLSGLFSSIDLPAPWFPQIRMATGEVILTANIGTVIIVR